MTKREVLTQSDYFSRARSPQSACETGVWKTRVRGKAVCSNVECQAITGTLDGEPRHYESDGKRIVNRAFDYTSAEIDKRVKNGLAVYCTDRACQSARLRASALRRKSKTVTKTVKAASR